MCQNRRLAQAGPFGVDHCAACDSLQVHVGPLTLRLDPLAVRELESVLTEALAELDREPEVSPSPRPLAN